MEKWIRRDKKRKIKKFKDTSGNKRTRDKKRFRGGGAGSNS